MKTKFDVMVIGTEPPCPICDLVSLFVTEEAGKSESITLRHCSYDSPDATALAQKLGLKVGTAKHVAQAAAIQMDWDAVYGLINRKQAQMNINCWPADTWTPELDGLLEPCQKATESVGYLMTPVLVING